MRNGEEPFTHHVHLILAIVRSRNKMMSEFREPVKVKLPALYTRRTVRGTGSTATISDEVWADALSRESVGPTSRDTLLREFALGDKPPP